MLYYLSDAYNDIIGWSKETGKPGLYREDANRAYFLLRAEALDFIKVLKKSYDRLPILCIERV